MVVQADCLRATCEPAARRLAAGRAQRPAAYAVHARLWRSLDGCASMHVSSTSERLPFKGQRALWAGEVSLPPQVTTHQLSPPPQQRLACDASSSLFPLSLVHPLNPFLFVFLSSAACARFSEPPGHVQPRAARHADQPRRKGPARTRAAGPPPGGGAPAAACCCCYCCQTHLLLALLLAALLLFAHAACFWRCCGLLAAAVLMC
jgi:hypothetical protein